MDVLEQMYKEVKKSSKKERVSDINNQNFELTKRAKARGNFKYFERNNVYVCCYKTEGPYPEQEEYSEAIVFIFSFPPIKSQKDRDYLYNNLVSRLEDLFILYQRKTGYINEGEISENEEFLLYYFSNEDL